MLSENLKEDLLSGAVASVNLLTIVAGLWSPVSVAMSTSGLPIWSRDSLSMLIAIALGIGFSGLELLVGRRLAYAALAKYWKASIVLVGALLISGSVSVCSSAWAIFSSTANFEALTAQARIHHNQNQFNEIVERIRIAEDQAEKELAKLREDIKEEILRQKRPGYGPIARGLQRAMSVRQSELLEPIKCARVVVAQQSSNPATDAPLSKQLMKSADQNCPTASVAKFFHVKLFEPPDKLDFAIGALKTGDPKALGALGFGVFISIILLVTSLLRQARINDQYQDERLETFKKLDRLKRHLVTRYSTEELQDVADGGREFDDATEAEIRGIGLTEFERKFFLYQLISEIRSGDDDDEDYNENTHGNDDPPPHSPERRSAIESYLSVN